MATNNNNNNNSGYGSPPPEGQQQSSPAPPAPQAPKKAKRKRTSYARPVCPSLASLSRALTNVSHPPHLRPQDRAFLENAFRRNPKPDGRDRDELIKHVSLSMKQLQVGPTPSSSPRGRQDALARSAARSNASGVVSFFFPSFFLWMLTPPLGLVPEPATARSALEDEGVDPRGGHCHSQRAGPCSIADGFASL